MKGRIARVAPEPEIYSLPHGAVYADQPYSTFRKTLRDNGVPVIRLGKRAYVRKSDLDALFQRNEDRSWTPVGSDKQFAAQRARRERERESAA